MIRNDHPGIYTSLTDVTLCPGQTHDYRYPSNSPWLIIPMMSGDPASYPTLGG